MGGLDSLMALFREHRPSSEGGARQWWRLAPKALDVWAAAYLHLGAPTAEALRIWLCAAVAQQFSPMDGE